MTTALRGYLRLLAGLTILSALGQLALPAQLAAASAWGFAPGWQREIGFWNLAMYIVIARTLWVDDALGGRTVAIALVLLQLVAGTNHAMAAIQSHAMLNTVMAFVNYACVLLAVLAVCRPSSRTQPPPSP